MTNNVAEMMSKAENQEILNKMRVALDADEEVARIMENADSIDDVYTVFSRYIKVKFEDFREALESTVEYLTQPKAMLSDDMLEGVTAAGFFSSVGGWFKRNWKTALLVTGGVVLAATGIGAAIGAGMMGASAMMAATATAVIDATANFAPLAGIVVATAHAGAATGAVIGTTALAVGAGAGAGACVAAAV